MIINFVLGITSGLSIFVGTIITFAHTGASINFIRTIGPAIVSGNTNGLGYILIGQTIGYVASLSMFNLRVMTRQWAIAKKFIM